MDTNAKNPPHPIIKICGLTSAEDVHLCLRHGIRHLGFVVEYPEEVPWNLSREEAKALLKVAAASLPPNEGTEASAAITTYMVCGGTAKEIIRLASEVRPTALQIHHKETVEDVALIIEAMKAIGVKVFRAVSPETPECYLAALCAMPDLDGLVADSRTPSTASHHGRLLDTAFYLRLRARFPRTIFLGGGITPDNIGDILAATHATALDILTGVESEPGRKDAERVVSLQFSVDRYLSSPNCKLKPVNCHLTTVN